jgi:hypothetical protein
MNVVFDISIAIFGAIGTAITIFTFGVTVGKYIESKKESPEIPNEDE